MRWTRERSLHLLVAAMGFTLACRGPLPGPGEDEQADASSDSSDSGSATTTGTDSAGTDSAGTDETETETTDDDESSSGDTTTEDETTTDGPDECCPLDMPMMVDVSGSTPDGPFESQYAWYGYHPPCCHPEDYFVFISATPEPWPGWGDEWMSDAVRIEIPGQTWTPMQWLGEGPATFRAGEHVIEAMITIDAIDTLDGFNGPFECYDGSDDWRTMVASFNVVGDGWNLTGSIAAPLCDAMTVIHPC